MQTAKQSRVTAQKINDLRRAAGNPLTHCPTCGHVVSSPYSRVVNGRRVEGCVDAAHVDHLPNGYAEWFYRPETRALRAKTLARLVEM